MRQATGGNPSSRKQLYAVLFEYPFGCFWKFMEAENEKEAKRLSIRWLMKLEKEELQDIVIREVKLVSSLKEITKLDGLIMK
jgi:hypothetical protein